MVGVTMERALTFDCVGQTLVGVVSASSEKARVGVLILVGGPQYRVGSHRQFVLLARHLALAGIPVMRFDFRGMGDSTGAPAKFEDTAPDIAAAIASFRNACPSIERVVLWGLCDAASTALLYWRGTHDAATVGMILLNPWVRSEQSLATTHVKHYYGKRVLERQFWKKLARGEVKIVRTLLEFLKTVIATRRSPDKVRIGTEAGFQDRMATALAGFNGPVLIILSGQDYTAKEFLEYTTADSRWRDVTTRENVRRVDLAGADHTFSTAAWRQQVEELTVEWLRRSFGIGK